MKNPERAGRAPRCAQAILQAACRAIVERGVERVRMSDIAAGGGRVGDPAALLLQDAVGASAARRSSTPRRGWRGSSSACRPGGPPRERLERLLLVYFDADPRVYEIWMLAREMTTRAIREPGLRDSHEDVYANWTSSIAAVIREGQRLRRPAGARSTPTGPPGA